MDFNSPNLKRSSDHRSGVAVTAPTALPQASDLAVFLGPSAPEVDSTQAAALIAYVARLSQRRRGVGFTAGVPNADLWQLILGATSRIYATATAADVGNSG